MFVAKIKCVSAVMLLLGLGACGVLLYTGAAFGPKTESPQPTPAPVAKPADPPIGEPKAITETTRRFAALAHELKMFQTDDLVGGRADKADYRIPKEWTEPWQKLYAAIASDKADDADLIGLLKHPDPKIRTLALATLFERQDPRLIPHFAAMIDDTEKTVPEVQFRRAFTQFPKGGVELEPRDFQDQTVGHVATRFLETWLEPAGYRVKNFAAYWAARKDRKYCTSWFLARYKFAGQCGSSHFDMSRAPRIRAIRKEIDALPAVDRDWMLLWVAARSEGWAGDLPPRAIATPQELLAVGKRLGPDRLMAMIRGEAISTDPNRTPSRGRGVLDNWVLRNGDALLRPKDIPELLTWPPFGTIAAAELQPAHASKWLRAAIERLTGDADGRYRATLAAALWRTVGASEIDYLADWFYRENVATDLCDPHSTFLTAIKGVRAPADRTLVARLIADPRLDKLDYQSLRALVWLVNGWTEKPVIHNQDLSRRWECGNWDPKTPRDFALVAQWRTKLRDSVKEWKQ